MFDFRLNATTNFDQESPTTAALVGGGFVTVWEDAEIDGFIDDGIYGYIASPTAFKREFRVPSDGEGDQFGPVVAGLPNGGFVVGWYTNEADDLGIDDPYDTPYIRFFDKEGDAVTGDIQLAPSQQGDVYLRDIAVLADGSVLFLSEETQSVASFVWDHTIRKYSETGTLLSGPVDIATDIFTLAPTTFSTYMPEARVVPLRDGGFLTTYWSNVPDPIGPNYLAEVFARAYNANGTARSAAINISAQAGAEDFSKFDYPEITDLDNGTVLVAWEADFDDWQGGNDDYLAIQYRYLTNLGEPVSEIFALDPPVEYQFKENDTLESVVALGGGYAGLVFTEFSEAQSDFYQDIYDVKMQILAPGGQKFGEPISMINSLKEDPDDVEVTVLESGEILTTYDAEADDADVFATFFDFDVADLIPDAAAAGGAQDNVFFFNPGTRTVGQFQMPFGEWSGIGSAGSGWVARGTGLFDSDDTSEDILWFNVNTRAVGRFDMAGGTLDGWAGIGRAGTGWEVLGAGDFNGDGTDDILWFNDTTNTVGQFRMNDGRETWMAIGNTGSSWSIAGIGDFNGDMRDDILWWNAGTRSLGQFVMSATGKTWRSIETLGNGFEVVGTGDFDGDGTSDVLLFNAASRSLGLYDMNAGQADWQSLGNTGAGWSVAGTGDFDNSGTDDILWRHSDGRIGQYQMDGSNFTWDEVGYAGTAWDVI